uniref:Uncharacterized protein n=1 Tax=viral metagenome TaxID=1070528 RepID=A0A6M3M3F4_9ZZZZ
MGKRWKLGFGLLAVFWWIVMLLGMRSLERADRIMQGLGETLRGAGGWVVLALTILLLWAFLCEMGCRLRDWMLR